jgi:uncharacterized membrane protein YqgA involved in biofilm formation
LPNFHQRHLVLFQWVMVVLRPCLLQVDWVQVVDFLWEVGVVLVVLGQGLKLLLVGSVPVVDFLWVVVVVPVVVVLEGPKKVAWNYFGLVVWIDQGQ